jgi:hypothetical protein
LLRCASKLLLAELISRPRTSAAMVLTSPAAKRKMPLV